MSDFSSPYESAPSPSPPPTTTDSFLLPCALSCLGVTLVMALVCGLGGWYVYRNAGNWVADVAQSSINSMVDQSELPDEEKAEIKRQVERVVTKYKAGQITVEQLARVMQELAESPAFATLMVYTAQDQYIDPSGLSAEEKEAARLVLERVARGVSEKKISPEQLDKALDFISTKDAQGQRQLNPNVSDPAVRDFVAELKRVADEAEIPEEPFKVNLGEEVRKAVDKALLEAREN